MKIHVFDVDRLWKHVLAGFLPNLGAQELENDLKMAAQNDPKSIKNQHQMTSKFGSILVSKKGPPGGIGGEGPAAEARALGGV